MYKIIYISTYDIKNYGDQLEMILEKSQVKNSHLEITGLMILKRDRILQLLEGPKKNVLELYETIKKDYRHHSIATVVEEETSIRVFKNWHMGFRDLENLDTEEYSYVKDFTDTLSDENIPKLFEYFMQSDAF